MKIIFIIMALHVSSDVGASDLRMVASEVCAPLRGMQFVGPSYHSRITNCEDLVVSQKIRNVEALRYTMQYFASNFGKLQDASCALPSLSHDDQCLLCRSPEQVSRGIRNGCTLVINDVESNHPQFSNRSTGYFINLCTRDRSSNVKLFYINRGKGHSGSSMYDDVAGRRSTLFGAFLMDTAVSRFHPFSNSQAYTSQCKPQQVRLIGLNSTNNDTDFSKPMHVSPFQSSWGCPSVSCDTVSLMQNLAENGPSLLMNYAHSRMANADINVRTGKSCNNGPDDSDPLARQLSSVGLVRRRSKSAGRTR